MNRRRTLGAALAAGLLLALSACATHPPKPVQATAIWSAGAHVNPNADGRASPVVVRVYQLRSDAQFRDAGFFALYNHEKQTLGNSLIAREERTLLPGQQLQMSLPLSKQARFIGAIAAFRDIRGAHWRAIVGTPHKSLLRLLARRSITIHVDGDAITLSTSH